MFGKLFRVKIRRGKRQRFIKFIQEDIRFAEKHERGKTLRFDLYPDPADKNAFFVYEAYRDRKAFKYHKHINPYYQRWEPEVRREMMKRPQKDFFEHNAKCSLGSKK